LSNFSLCLGELLPQLRRYKLGDSCIFPTALFITSPLPNFRYFELRYSSSAINSSLIHFLRVSLAWLALFSMSSVLVL